MIMIIIFIIYHMANTSHNWSQIINKSGYRITGARQMIVEIILESDRALTPMDIFIEARERGKRMGLVTVYRTLEKLEEINLVERVHQEDGCHAYIAHVDGHKHLLLCRYCHRVVYFGGDNLTDLTLSISLQSGYEIHDHWLQLIGICPDCRENQNQEILE